MRYDHMVKFDGRYYPAGEDVPDNTTKKMAVDETLPPYSDKDIVLETQPDTKEKTEKQYTKSEINRLSTAELQELASSVGIDGADEMTGSTLKKLLIEHFEL